jgi:hypothetical protein
VTKVIAEDLFAAIHVVGIALLVAMLFRSQLRAKCERRCVGSATAIDLAWIRILACACLIVYIFTEDLGSLAQFDAKWYDWPGYTERLKRGVLKFFVESEGNLDLLTNALLGVLVLAMFGVGTRITIPLATVLYIIYAALLRSFGKYFHDGYLVMYAMMVLCFLPSGDAWSFDAWFRNWRYQRRGEVPPPKIAAYNWMVWAVWAAISVAYLQLAMSKFANGGLYWFDGRSLRNYMITDDLNLTEWDLDFALGATAIPTVFWTFAGFFALAAETLYAFTLVSLRLRRVIPYAVAMLHLGVWFGQDALFVDAILMPFAFWQPSKRLFPPPLEAPRYTETTTGPPVRRLLHRLRGPTIPIVIAVLVLVCDQVTYRVTFKYKWPLEGWQMYAGKMNPAPAVSYRRFMATYPDGSRKQTGLSECAAFLEKPYRLDFGLIKNLPGFLTICAQRIPNATALTYEARVWEYRKRALDEHLTDPPYYSYRVELAQEPPMELRSRQRDVHALLNGGFEDLDLSTGNPVSWIVPQGAFIGTVFDRATWNNALLVQEIPTGPAPQVIRQIIELPVKGDRIVIASVLVKTRTPGGSLAIEFDGGQPTSVPLPHDGAWHRVEVTANVPAVNTRASIALTAIGETWFDDAVARHDLR